MKRSCDACHKQYAAKSKLSKFCTRPECKRARARTRKRVARSSTPDNVVELVAGGDKADTPAPVGSVAAATRAELEAAGKVSTTIGQAALVLAHQLDTGYADTGSSKASVARQLQALMADALKGAKGADNPLDELRAKRERRLAGA